MYDPLVVDAFVSIVRQSTELDSAPTTESQHAAVELSKAIAANATLQPPSRSLTVAGTEFAEAFALCRSITTRLGADERSALIRFAVQQLSTMLRADLFVVFRHDPRQDVLVPEFISTDGGTDLYGFCIPVGQRLSGWVAATRVPVLNANPALDYGELDLHHFDEYRSVLSVALSLGDVIAGVICAYSRRPDGFSVRDQQVCEIVAPHVALALAASAVKGRGVAQTSDAA
jgi:GAF domain-containing protein